MGRAKDPRIGLTCVFATFLPSACSGYQNLLANKPSSVWQLKLAHSASVGRVDAACRRGPRQTAIRPNNVGGGRHANSQRCKDFGLESIA